MAQSEDKKPWVDIENILNQGNSEELHEYLDTLAPPDIARAISRLSESKQSTLLTILEPEDAADLIEELPDAQGADMMEDLPADQAAAIVDEMESDERADLLGEMTEQDAEAILQEMTPEDAEDTRELLQYQPDTAGGLMMTEFVVYNQSLLVKDVLNDLRTNAEAYSDYGVQYAYVENDSQRLVGVLRLRDLVLSQGDTPIQQIYIVNPISVLVKDNLEELEKTFDRFMFSGLPVVNNEGTIVGVVQRADIEEAHSEQTEKVFMRFSGIISGEELRTEPVVGRSGKRLAWLGLNLVLSTVAASVIILFEETVQQHLALVALLPVMANLSGCSGNQAVAVSIREMALGLIRGEDVLRVMRMELVVGIINGLVLGAMLAGITLLFEPNLMLGVAVGIALALNTVLAVVLGGSLPLMLKKAGIDPAVAAAPILTTIVDMCGFFLMLSLVSSFLF
jgi:magnesium transporter